MPPDVRRLRTVAFALLAVQIYAQSNSPLQGKIKAFTGTHIVIPI
nr:MAG TPA: hypothetical protein [Bacteriophage sp.]